MANLKSVLNVHEKKGNARMEILDLILSKSNLNDAYRQVYRNKGVGGVDGVTVEMLKSYLKENINNIIKQIKTRTYKPKPALRVEIPKDNGKVRLLGIQIGRASCRERV